jgi:hypothetical protein
MIKKKKLKLIWKVMELISIIKEIKINQDKEQNKWHLI